MGKSKRDALVEDLIKTHDEYLAALIEFEEPAHRKLMAEESIKNFDEKLESIKSGNMTIADAEYMLEAIKQSTTVVKYPKGTCSAACFEKLIMAQNLIIGRALEAKLPDQVRIGLLEMSIGTIRGVMEQMIIEANGKEVPWKVRDKIHEVTSSAIDLLIGISDSVKEGKVLVMKVPNPNSTGGGPDDKGKAFWN